MRRLTRNKLKTHGNTNQRKEVLAPKKADGPENPDNEDIEEDTEIDIVNMMPKKRKLKKKGHGTTGGTGPRRNLHSHDKTRHDKTRSKLLFICKKKKKLFFVFWLI